MATLEKPRMIPIREAEEDLPPSVRRPPRVVFWDQCKMLLNPKNSCRWSRKVSTRLRNVPFFILLISTLQVVTFYAADDKLKRFLPYRSENKTEIWRFLTYMLLHTNAVHLGLNVLIQSLLGTPLELEQGWARCAFVYFGGGLAGSLAASAFASFSSMVGASAGVYALLISQIPNIVLNYETIKYAAYRIVTVVALTTSDVIYIFCHVYYFNNERPRIGWVAHASGAAAGLLLGFLSFEGSSKWKKNYRMMSCLILALLLLLTVAFSLAPSTLGLLAAHSC